VLAVAVRGLHEQHVGRVDETRILEDRSVPPSQVSRKHHAAFWGPIEIELHRGRSQDVARVPEDPLDPVGDGIRLSVRPGHELRQHPLHVLHRVQGLGGLVLGIPKSVGVGRLLFLEIGGVPEENRRQLPRGGRAIDGTLESPMGKEGEVARVVQVRVTQHHRVDGLGVDGGSGPVPEPQLLETLKQPAVQQDAGPVGGDEVFGSGDGAGTAQEADTRRF
jgi:hypothetical protein